MQIWVLWHKFVKSEKNLSIMWLQKKPIKPEYNVRGRHTSFTRWLFISLNMK
jgi:hypothetical protein